MIKLENMVRICIILINLLLVFSACSRPKEDPSQWRGENRQGIFYETGLMTEWPADGPGLLWSYTGLGAGHSSVGIGNNWVFINGMKDTLGVLSSFDMEGNLLWEKVYGTEWHKNYTGTRSTPVIKEGLVYLLSGMGVVYCMDASSGDPVWEVDLTERFAAEVIRWGMAETLLIDGDNVICTPGGEEFNVVALHRLTGETVWTSKGYGELSAYCSPVLVEHNNTRLIVTMTVTSVIGIDAGTGEVYWRVEQRQRNDIHANSPVYSEGIVYCLSASAAQNSGFLALELSDDGKQVTQLWRNESFQNLMGGVVVLNNVLYSSFHRKNEWHAIDASTGKEKKLSGDFGGGVIVYADGHFYLYSEAGEVALVKMDRNTFDIHGRFEVPLGTDQHWAHPVIKDKKLYIRHGDAVMVYDIAA